MLLFRSEEHVDRWSRERGIRRGATLTTAQVWRLARAWYSDKLSPSWRRRTPEEAQRVFEEAGLSGQFWRLIPSPA